MRGASPLGRRVATHRARRIERFRFLRRLSWRDSLPLYAAVGCTFGIIGFVSDLVGLPALRPYPVVLASVVMCGLISCGYLSAAVHGMRWIPALIAIQIGATVAIDRLLPGHSAASEPKRVAARASADGAGTLLLAAGGYGLFISFITRQGVRQVRLQTEMSLAQQIHADLVPPIARQLHGVEILGRSQPSTEVGGDLLDVLDDCGAVLALVADVSGHGVPAGTLMAMVRSAVRVRVASGAELEELVADLDRLLVDLARPDKFVTLALLRLDGQGQAQALLAGHLPIVVVRAGSRAVEHVENQRPPLGLPTAAGVTRLDYAPGDLFALLTDGLPETMNRAGHQLELAPIEQTLRERADAPLESIAAAVFEQARRHGAASDDRTLLLLRAGSPR